MNLIWNANGCELPVDVEDAAFMQRYEAAAAAISDEPCEDDADGIRQYCQNYRAFYDALFGEGTSEQLCGNLPDNRRAYDELFMELLKVMLEQRLTAKLRLAEAVKKYVSVE